MVGDEAFRRCIAALWALMGAVRDRAGTHVDAAVEAALQALAEARGGDHHVLVHVQEGAVHVNGRQLQLGVDVFVAAQGIAALLRSRGVGEILFDASVDHEGLEAWARCWAVDGNGLGDPETELARRGARGIHACRHSSDGEPLLPLRRSSARPDAPDSHLRSVFLQHQLIAAIPASSLVPPTVAKVVVGAVVDRLLGVTGGLDPLMLLQRDPALLQRSLHTAVLAVVLSRVAGWPDHSLTDLGAAALLHDLGGLMDPAAPERAAFVWLLEHGRDDFWLRSAIVARTWREDHGGELGEVSTGNGAAAALVRLAVEVERHARGADGAAAPLLPRLRTLAAKGTLPRELVEVIGEAFPALAG